MKRTSLMLSILLMLAMAGCSHTTDPASQPDAGNSSKTETTDAMQSTTSVTTESTPVETEPATETTEAITSTEATTETTQTTVSSDVPTEQATQETRIVSKSPQDLLGKWQFPDGYNLKFLENNVVELSIDFSYDLQFKENTILYQENSYPFKVDGDTVTATGNGKSILAMTATEGADAAALKGRFRLDACQVYIDQVIDHTEQTKTYFIDLRDEKTYLIMPSAYRAEEGVLTMIDEEGEMHFQFEIKGDTLHIIDEEGYRDVLTRVG